MLLREMKDEDIKEVLEIERTIFKSSAMNEKQFEYELNTNVFSHYYVLIETSIIGYMGLYDNEENGEITNIAIDKQYQGNGYSHLLMNYAIDLLKERNNISLEVRVSNNKAISLYKKHGFIIVAKRKNYYSDNHEDAYLMVRERKL